jgi:hypothetical protein
MSIVVFVVRRRLATRAQIKVGTDSTLVTHSADPVVMTLSGTMRTVTIDTIVMLLKRVAGSTERAVYSSETMSRMNLINRLVAGGAKIPVRASEALMADSIDLLIAPITDSKMSEVSSGGKQCLLMAGELHLTACWLEFVARIVTVTGMPLSVARKTQIIILANSAFYKVALCGVFATAVACTIVLISFIDRHCLYYGRSRLDRLRANRSLAANLSSARSNLAINNSAFNHPVIRL